MRPARARLLFALLLVVYAGYAALYIFRSSFILDGRRYFCLLDDAMISMRYARNLASGHGLVWNPGEPPVEGYTNPLWVAGMALVHLLDPPRATSSLAIQVAGAVLVAATLVFVRRIVLLLHVRSDGAATWALVAAALTAFYLPLNVWSLLGMEVGALAFLVTAATFLALEGLRRETFPRRLYPLLAVATLVRLDGLVPYLALLGCMCLLQPGQRRRHLVTGLGIALGSVLLQTGLRLLYYGDSLPNTYYLKLAGAPLALRFTSGLAFLRATAAQMGVVYLLAGATGLLLLRQRWLLLPAAVVGAQAAYSVWVGGDAWESWGGMNRFLAVAAPCFFVLFSLGLAGAAAAASRRVGSRPGAKRALQGLGVTVALTALIRFNTLVGPESLRQWLLLDPHPYVYHHRLMTEMGILLEQITEPTATIAVAWAGIIPYFSGRPAVDLLGKSDPVIARGPMRLDQAWMPGHMKWNYPHSVAGLKPDVLAQIWRSWDEIRAVVERDYTEVTVHGFLFRLRRGSPAIRWRLLEALAAEPEPDRRSPPATAAP